MQLFEKSIFHCCFSVLSLSTLCVLPCEPLTFIYRSEWGHKSSPGSPTLPAIFYLPRTKSFCQITTVYETQWPPISFIDPQQQSWTEPVNASSMGWNTRRCSMLLSADLHSCSSIIRQRLLPSQPSDKSTCELWGITNTVWTCHKVLSPNITVLFRKNASLNNNYCWDILRQLEKDRVSFDIQVLVHSDKRIKYSMLGTPGSPPGSPPGSRPGCLCICWCK